MTASPVLRQTIADLAQPDDAGVSDALAERSAALEASADRAEEVIARLTEEVSRLRAEREWQPIEMAPIRAKRLDLWCTFKNGKGGRRVPDCYWSKRRGAWACTHTDGSGASLLHANLVPIAWTLPPTPPVTP